MTVFDLDFFGKVITTINIIRRVRTAAPEAIYMMSCCFFSTFSPLFTPVISEFISPIIGSSSIFNIELFFVIFLIKIIIILI